jgi:uncharacterized membrane protein
LKYFKKSQFDILVLNNLNISFNRIFDDMSDTVFKNMKSISCRDNHILKKEDVLYILQMCPFCIYFDITECVQLLPEVLFYTIYIMYYVI